MLPFYQARAGQRLALALGVDRLRAHSLKMQQRMAGLLRERGFAAQGGTEDRGAFIVVTDPRAEVWARALHAGGVIADARGPYLRFCPDILSTDAELVSAAERLAAIAT